MKRAGILLAAALLSVAGCSKPVEQQVRADVAPAVLPAPAGPSLAGGSWDGLFGDADHAVDLFGRVGLRPGPYEQAGLDWRSEGIPTPMSDPSGQAPAIAHFVATGDADTLRQVAFTLVEPQASDDRRVRREFERWVGEALAKLGMPGGDTALKAISGNEPQAGTLAGGIAYAVTDSADAKERRLAVTFTRAAPISGAASNESI